MASDGDKSGWSLPNIPDKIKSYGPPVAVAGATIIAFPFVLAFAGFKATGIAAGSLAAKAMSASAVANGGGVAAGSIVATCQSVGAAGLGLSAKAAIGGASGGIYSYFTGSKKD